MLRGLSHREHTPKPTEDYFMNNSIDMPSQASVTILVVEDHDELRSSLVVWLQSIFKDFTFVVAKTGEEALDMVAKHQPCIVLMDVQLPKMNGIEAVRRIKHINPQTNAVILSTYDYPVYREEAKAAGAYSYINKQTMHLELIPTLIKLLPAKLVSTINIDF
jgi:two-component system NarL family response regulator